MLVQKSKKIKTITANDPFDFDMKLNSFTDDLDRNGAPYTVAVNPAAGLLAFVEYQVTVRVPQCARDEYELMGERHICIECPRFVRPTDGRVRYTKCPFTGKLATADGSCCDDFYEWLKAGEIELTNMAAKGGAENDGA